MIWNYSTFCCLVCPRLPSSYKLLYEYFLSALLSHLDAHGTTTVSPGAQPSAKCPLGICLHWEEQQTTQTSPV